MLPGPCPTKGPTPAPFAVCMEPLKWPLFCGSWHGEDQAYAKGPARDLQAPWDPNRHGCESENMEQPIEGLLRPQDWGISFRSSQSPWASELGEDAWAGHHGLHCARFLCTAATRQSPAHFTVLPGPRPSLLIIPRYRVLEAEQEQPYSPVGRDTQLLELQVGSHGIALC